MSDFITAEELAELEKAGAKVKRPEQKKKPEPRKAKAPERKPEAAMLAVRAADNERRLAEGEANRQLMAMTNELLRSMRDELVGAIKEGPRRAPWSFSVQRDKKGLIETIRAVPED